MHVLYDGRIYLTQAAGGINRYFANVIDRLPGADRVTMTLPRLPRVNFPSHPNLHTIVARKGAWDGVTRPWQLRAGVRGLRPDVLHPTYYRLLDHRSMARSRAPIVLTVHDMVHERFREQLDPHGIRGQIKRRALRAASAIICVSHATRRELLEFHPWLSAESLHVVHHASELGGDSARDQSVVPEGPYLLHVGSRFWYKDFDLALRALAVAASEHPDVRLAVVGPQLTGEEQALIRELGLSGRVLDLGVADDAQLAALYAGSLALVYPSRYEGFGIPPLEAMACGTLVVAADASSIPEVVQDAALLFAPTSLEGLTAQLRAVLEGSVDRADLLARGRARAGEFSWERTARDTRAVYESVM